jgi:hypothetical protein
MESQFYKQYIFLVYQHILPQSIQQSQHHISNKDDFELGSKNTPFGFFIKKKDIRI